MSQKEGGVLVLTSVNEDYKLRVTANPFQAELQFKDETVLSMNSNGLLYFEHLQPPPCDRYSIFLSHHILIWLQLKVNNPMGIEYNTSSHALKSIEIKIN